MIDAVSIKEGEGIPESGKTVKSAENLFSDREESFPGRMVGATRAATETLSEVCCQGWGGLKRAFDYTRHRPMTLILLGTGAGLVVGLMLYRGRK